MPFKSQAQRRKFAQLLVEGKISADTFEEWNRETGARKLPERARAKSTKAAKSAKTKRAKAAKGSATGGGKGGSRKRSGSRKTAGARKRKTARG